MNNAALLPSLKRDGRRAAFFDLCSRKLAQTLSIIAYQKSPVNLSQIYPSRDVAGNEIV
jgi:chromosome segregation and condensation protein ScpB